MKIAPFGAVEAPGGPSSVEGFPSYRHARAGLHAESFGSGAQVATSSCWAERSSTAEDAAHAERRVTPQLAKAWSDTGSEGSTSIAASAAMAAGHRCSCAGHVAMAMLPTLASLIVVYDTRLGGREVSAFELRPSYRWYLDKERLSAMPDRDATRI